MKRFNFVPNSLSPAASALTLLAALGIAGLRTPASAAAQDDTATLRQEIDATREAVTELTRELGETRERLDLTLVYLESQKKAARAMGDVLSAAESAGFTAGINYQSREMLLAGWRDQLAALRAELPTALPVADAPQ